MSHQKLVLGVSIDEEMTNLIKFQQAYDAAAKFISQGDDMLRTIIEMV
jgi:flagellar hook-associated protein 1